MTDHTKLKNLAEAATPGPWGYDGSYVCPSRVEDGTTYVESWRSIADCHQPENTKFIAAANPAAVLALIADLDEAKNGMKHSCAIRLKKQIDQLKAELEDFKQGAKAEADAGDEARAEVRKLKAENEALHGQVKVLQSDANSWQSGYNEGRGMGAKHMVSEVDRLKTENEALSRTLADVREALEREYWSEYAGLEETRGILDAAMGKAVTQ